MFNVVTKVIKLLVASEGRVIRRRPFCGAFRFSAPGLVKQLNFLYKYREKYKDDRQCCTRKVKRVTRDTSCLLMYTFNKICYGVQLNLQHECVHTRYRQLGAFEYEERPWSFSVWEYMFVLTLEFSSGRFSCHDICLKYKDDLIWNHTESIVFVVSILISPDCFMV